MNAAIQPHHSWLPTRLAIALIATGSLLLLGGCRSTHSPKREASTVAPRVARINHLAFFKLKNPADAAELIADCDAQLGTLPMVTMYYCGQHMDTGRGERVDSNFDVGFFVGFESTDDYADYVEHPNHQALVAKWQPRWEWIRVQDVLDETP